MKGRHATPPRERNATPMTTEERFERIEHLTAGLAEERRKDREEYRQLWRDTQRQINDLTLKIADTNDAVTRLADETRQNIDRLADETRQNIDRLANEARAADQALGARVEALVSAIGQILAK